MNAEMTGLYLVENSVSDDRKLFNLRSWPVQLQEP
jgi:hypothetical protein